MTTSNKKDGCGRKHGESKELNDKNPQRHAEGFLFGSARIWRECWWAQQANARPVICW